VLRSIIISPDPEMAHRLIAALEATGQVEVDRTIDHYPTALELIRSLRALATEILFINFESLTKGLEIVHILEAEASPMQIVGFHRQLDPAMLRETMRAGVREFLTDPFEPRAVLETLASIKTQLVRRPAVYETTNQIFSFLPSKAGVGTSTIAANVSAALARRPRHPGAAIRFRFKLRHGALYAEADEWVRRPGRHRARARYGREPVAATGHDDSWAGRAPCRPSQS
jgi:DNA-binding NarL/FixJ family response regulator